MNPLLNNNGNQTQTINNQQGINNFGQLYAQVMKNPEAFLLKLGIPQNITTPQAAVQWLVNNGKVTQNQVNQIAAQIGFKG